MSKRSFADGAEETRGADSGCRSNPAVVAAADKVFLAIVSAIEAETLQGQTAQRVVNAAKRVVQLARLDLNQLKSRLRPETQQTIRLHFL